MNDQNPEPQATPKKKDNGWIVIALIVAVIGGGIWVWEEVLEDRFIAKRFGVVIEGEVYRSGQLSQYVVKDVLEKNNIQVIVDLTGDEPDSPSQNAEAAAARELGIDRKKFPLRGNGTGDIVNYADAIAMMHQARADQQPVLVHCAAGSQRTGGAVTFYRLLVLGQSPEQAQAEMERYDWDPKGDKVLTQYINEHMAQLAGLLVERNVIETIPDPLPVFGQ